MSYVCYSGRWELHLVDYLLKMVGRVGNRNGHIWCCRNSAGSHARRLSMWRHTQTPLWSASVNPKPRRELPRNKARKGCYGPSSALVMWNSSRRAPSGAVSVCLPSCWHLIHHKSGVCSFLNPWLNLWSRCQLMLMHDWTCCSVVF